MPDFHRVGTACGGRRGGLRLGRTEQLLELLERKRALFERYKKASEALLTCDAENGMDYYMAQREHLIDEIDRVDNETARLCGDDRLSLDASRARCNWGDLPEELHPVFDAAKKNIALAAQVQRLEPQIIARMREERDRLEEKIRSINKSQASQASRYFSGVGVGERAVRGGGFRKI